MKYILSFLLINIFYLLACPIYAVSKKDIEIRGIVKDAINKKKLGGVGIFITGSDIGTVTNSDGSFIIKVPDSLSTASLNIRELGYSFAAFPIEELEKRNTPLTFLLNPISKELKEVSVYGAEPLALVTKAIEKIADNYPGTSDMFTAFYRETIQKGRKYIGVSEAVVDVYKKPYNYRNIDGDRVAVKKGRRVVSQKNSDTLAVKIVGGPNLPVFLDIVKNPDILLDLDELRYYNFKLESTTSIDGRLQYVVSFTPKKVKIDYALFKGVLYIDMETFSFTRAEYSLDTSDKNLATQFVLYKKPKGLRFNLQDMEFIIGYKYSDGKSYLNYINTRTKFKCDWKRRLFSSSYVANAELVMVDRIPDSDLTVSKKEAFDRRGILYDVVDDFNDPDFWADYNIIEPTRSLENAILKLVR